MGVLDGAGYNFLRGLIWGGGGWGGEILKHRTGSLCRSCSTIL